MKGFQYKTAYLTSNVCFVSPVWSMGPIYGRFMGFIVTGFPLYKPLHREKTVYSTTQKNGHKSARGPHRS